MTRTIEHIRAGIWPSVPPPRPCLGYDGHPCDTDLGHKHIRVLRCESCRANNKRICNQVAQNRRRQQMREMEARAVLTDAQLTGEIVRMLRNDVLAGEVCDRLGITRQKLRALHCAHYQRRAVMEAAPPAQLRAQEEAAA